MYDFTNYTAEQLEERANQILQEMTQDGANLEELRAEAQAIAEERSARAENAARNEQHRRRCRPRRRPPADHRARVPQL